MAKQKKEEAPPAGSPAWMATYGDLMTLLLCFFVLLFSMSSVDAQKFELIAASFSNTFSIFSAGATAIGDGVLISNGVSQLNQLDQYMYSTGKAAENDAESTEFDELQQILEQEQLRESEELATKIEEALKENNLDAEIDIDFTSQYVQLTLRGSILFDSGSATLRAEAMPTIQKIGVILERYAESTIEIEGHTDNVPINSGKFENNDVLSSYRALSMFEYLVENTAIDPATIKHSGRGEYLPIADNSTQEGRSKNRRIEIKIYNTLSGE
ncbi:MAG: flagellar motor protein MotB [Lachnospiraceae bacterium]